MSKLFISYRRDDSADVTGRLHDRLKGHFGDGTIFLDIDTIPFGMDFRKCIGDAVNQCDVLLAVIGDHWLDARYADGPQQGSRRLDDPHDYVRIEIEAALARGIPVVPLLVGKASMPAEAQLPDGLKELAFRHAAEARSGPDFQGQVDRLIRGLDQLLARKRELRAGVEKAIHIADEDPQMALGRARMVLELRGPRRLRAEVPRTARHAAAGEPDPTTRQRGGPSRPVRCRRAARQAERARHRSLGREDRARGRSSIARAIDRHPQMVHRGRTARCPGPEPRPAPKAKARRDRARPGCQSLWSKPGLPLFPRGCGRSTPTIATSSLQLLPGPRDKDGLPESIRFWKHRIESRDDPSFTVGVIYGPSGCGKSSLVKAGLLPRLARRVIAVYVEATPRETEARILSGLRKKFPDLDAKPRPHADDHRAAGRGRA